ncbi:uncharacterized protein ACO6RY_12800 [Pungitius sinensis]
MLESLNQQFKSQLDGMLSA